MGLKQLPCQHPILITETIGLRNLEHVIRVGFMGTIPTNVLVEGKIVSNEGEQLVDL